MCIKYSVASPLKIYFANQKTSPIPRVFSLLCYFAANNLLTIVEVGLIVRVRPILHHHALGLVRVECHLGGPGAEQVDKLAGMLVLLPVAAGQVVIGVAGVQVEALVLGGGAMLGVSRGGGAKCTKQLDL